MQNLRAKFIIYFVPRLDANKIIYIIRIFFACTRDRFVIHDRNFDNITANLYRLHILSRHLNAMRVSHARVRRGDRSIHYACMAE